MKKLLFLLVSLSHLALANDLPELGTSSKNKQLILKQAQDFMIFSEETYKDIQKHEDFYLKIWEGIELVSLSLNNWKQIAQILGEIEVALIQGANDTLSGAQRILINTEITSKINSLEWIRKVNLGEIKKICKSISNKSTLSFQGEKDGSFKGGNFQEDGIISCDYSSSFLQGPVESVKLFNVGTTILEDKKIPLWEIHMRISGDTLTSYMSGGFSNAGEFIFSGDRPWKLLTLKTNPNKMGNLYTFQGIEESVKIFFENACFSCPSMPLPDGFKIDLIKEIPTETYMLYYSVKNSSQSGEFVLKGFSSKEESVQVNLLSMPQQVTFSNSLTLSIPAGFTGQDSWRKPVVFTARMLDEKYILPIKGEIDGLKDIKITLPTMDEIIELCQLNAYSSHSCLEGQSKVKGEVEKAFKNILELEEDILTLTYYADYVGSKKKGLDMMAKMYNQKAINRLNILNNQKNEEKKEEKNI